ncbi:MAG: DUF3754 domain-containing protein [Isosphaeraceae bacterium]
MDHPPPKPAHPLTGRFRRAAVPSGSEPPIFPGGKDRSLPISTIDLDRLLLAQPELGPDEQAALGRLQALLSATFHHEFHARHTDLKAHYAPLDPDGLDDRRLWGGRPGSEADEEFLRHLEAALVHANFQKLEAHHIAQAVAAPNGMGRDFLPDFEIFEHLHVYVRGRCQIRRKLRNPRAFFRHEERTFEAYRRVLILLKFKPDAPLDDYIRDDVVYLRMYRDVPFAEMDIHLPEQGTRPRLRWLDRAQIASPIVTGLPTLIAKIAFGGFLASVSPMALATILAIPVGASLKTFFGFRQNRSRHLHFMIRHLYYLTQANNASVLARLVDSAEEEEYKETLLAYYLLWQTAAGSPVPWDQDRLDHQAEAFLRDRVGIDTDFEVGDALKKLLRLGLVELDEDGNPQALPIAVAIRRLEQAWAGALPNVQQSSKNHGSGLCDPSTGRLQ